MAQQMLNLGGNLSPDQQIQQQQINQILQFQQIQYEQQKPRSPVYKAHDSNFAYTTIDHTIVHAQSPKKTAWNRTTKLGRGSPSPAKVE